MTSIVIQPIMKSVGDWKNVNKYDCLQCLSVIASALLVFRLAFVVQKRFPNSEEVLIYL